MGEFFKPWQRRIGCVTLLMACAFMVGWVRSEFSEDYVWTKTSEESSLWVSSFCGRIQFLFQRGDEDVALKRFGLNSNKRNFKDDPVVAGWGNPLKFHKYRDHYMDSGVSSYSWTFAYWSIVIPLTLISACLLLVKPRKSKLRHEKPIPE